MPAGGVVVTASHGGSTENINTSQTGALFEAFRDHVPGLDVAANGGLGLSLIAARFLRSMRSHRRDVAQ